MSREEALQVANVIVAECIATKDRLVQEVLADHLIRLEMDRDVKAEEVEETPA